MTGTVFSEKQKQAMQWWKDARYDAILCDGAVRSGKTFCLALGFFRWAMLSFSGCAFAVCGKSVGAARRNVIAAVKPLLVRWGFRMVKLRGQNGFALAVGGRWNAFYLFGGMNEGSADLIQGMTLAGVLLDEAALMPKSFVQQACARCSVVGAKVWLSCNPEGKDHWLYREWIEKAEEKHLLRLSFSMQDNPALAPEARQRYERMYSGVFYRRFVLGEWIGAEGRVYDFFSEEMVAEPPERCEKWVISCDYGTVNPCSFGLWGKSGGVWYRVAEYYYDSRKEGVRRTDGEYLEALRRLADGRRISAVVVDPSAASFMELLRQAGYPAVKGKNDVLSGIRLTAELLRQGKIVLCRGCDAALREIERYVWDGGDRVKKQEDHAMDDMRYFAATICGREHRIGAVSAERREEELQ